MPPTQQKNMHRFKHDVPDIDTQMCNRKNTPHIPQTVQKNKGTYDWT